MKTTRSIILLAVIVVAGGFTMRATWETNQNQSASRALASQRSSLLAEATRIEHRLRTSEQALAKLSEKPEGERRGAKGRDASEAGGKDTRSKQVAAARPSARTIIANDSHRMAEYARNLRARMDLDYERMGKAVGLSAAEVEKMKDLSTWMSQGWTDVEAVAEMQGLDPQGVATKKLGRKEVALPWMAKMKELLGDRMDLWWEDTHRKFMRAIVQDMAGYSIYSSEPLKGAQAEQTTQILAANSQRFSTASASWRGFYDPDTLNWNAARAQLQRVLSPTQIATLGDFIEYGARQRKFDERQARLTAEFKAKLSRK